MNSGGTNLTINDFANAGSVPPNLDVARYVGLGRSEDKGARLVIEYQPKPWFKPNLSYSWSRTEYFNPGTSILPTIGNKSSPNTLSLQVRLPAGYPGNPFGVPIYVDRVFWELQPYLSVHSAFEKHSLSMDFGGELPGGWRYLSSIERNWNYYLVDGMNFAGASVVQAAVNNGDPLQRPILLNDGRTTSPNPAAMLQSFITPVSPVVELPLFWNYSIVADGGIASLPVGEVKAAIGMEFREEYARWRIDPTSILVSSGLQIPRAPMRRLKAAFGEIQIPLIGDRQRLRFVKQAGLNLSARYDEYSDFGAKFTPRYSAHFSPIAGLTFRGSYGSGFRTPTLFQQYRPVTSGSSALGSVAAPIFDPMRGGQAYIGTTQVLRLSGGNTGLKPEQSTNISSGLNWAPTQLKGFSLTLNYYSVRIDNRVGVPDIQTIINFFPALVTRAAPSVSDQSVGWSGIVTGLDTRTINLAYVRSAGWDGELRYRRSSKHGEVDLRVLANFPVASEIRALPTQPLFNNVDARPWRGTASVHWSKGAVGFGVTASYTEAYRANLSPSLPGTPVPSVTLWDFQANYDFKRAGLGRGYWQRLLSTSNLTFGIVNAFNREPDMFAGNVLGNVDPRGRRYLLSLRTEF